MSLNKIKRYCIISANELYLSNMSKSDIRIYPTLRQFDIRSPLPLSLSLLLHHYFSA